MRLWGCLEVSMCSPLETGGQWLAMVVRMPVERGLNTNPIRWFTICQKKTKKSFKWLSIYLKCSWYVHILYLFMIWDPQVFSFSISLEWMVAIIEIWHPINSMFVCFKLRVAKTSGPQTISTNRSKTGEIPGSLWQLNMVLSKQIHHNSVEVVLVSFVVGMALISCWQMLL